MLGCDQASACGLPAEGGQEELMRAGRPMTRWGPAVTLALMLALMSAGVRAQTQQDPKGLDAGTVPQTETAPPGQGWWAKILRDLPNCVIHTDGCRLCRMKEAGISCSNSPIA